eukprot:PhM_4_TR12282/c0_g1_i1/m.56379/K01507/ppa; inorganic pyrophosphatase
MLSPGDIQEAFNRSVTESDYVAYAKEDVSEATEIIIMQRLFDALDPLHKGAILEANFEPLLKRLGDSLSKPEREQLREKLFPKGTTSITFDAFYSVWKDHDHSHRSREQFALMSGGFRDPYTQQQLVIKEEGEKYSAEYRIHFYFQNMDTQELVHVSPWHDIPLMVRDIVRTVSPTHTDDRYNFICEIPKWTRAKFEVATKERYNPIKQDIKNGVPRFYKHGDMLFNYGCLPQTWESPEQSWPGTDVFGDNDPMDVIEIGMLQQPPGSVTQVKVLGILGMVDHGEMDWKVIAISATDPLNAFLNDIEDVPKYLPGVLEAVREWLRVYKICQGGVANEFAFGGEYKNKDFAKKIIHESYLMWCNLHKIRGAQALD